MPASSARGVRARASQSEACGPPSGGAGSWTRRRFARARRAWTTACASRERDHDVGLVEGRAERRLDPITGQEGRGLGGVPGEDLLDLAGAGTAQHARGRGGEEAGAVSPCVECGDGATQQEHVSERASADEQDVQGIA